jgi:ABC-type phosphate transport system auxiliary subunit
MTTSNSQLEQRVQVLEDEVNILKTEIRQILIDMRDTWLRKSDVLATSREIVQAAAPTLAATPQSAISALKLDWICQLTKTTKVP